MQFVLYYLLSGNKRLSLCREKYSFVIKKKIDEDIGCRVIDRMQIAGRHMRSALVASRKSTARVAEDKAARIFYESFLTCERENAGKKLCDPHLSRYDN